MKFVITTNPFVDQFHAAQQNQEAQLWNNGVLVATITPSYAAPAGILITRAGFVSIDPNNPADALQQLVAPLILEVTI